MDIEELRSYIDIIFAKEKIIYEHAWVFRHEKDIMNCVLSYPTSDTLVDLFSTIQNKEELKLKFLQELEYSVRESDELWSRGVDALCFHTLIRLGFVDRALNAFKDRKKSSDILITLIYDLLEHNLNYFDIKQLDEILNKLRTIKITTLSEPTKNSLILRIINDRYELFKKIIRGVNVEINLDKKTVSEKIGYLGLDEKYKKLLDEIDDFINTDTSEFVNAGMISNMRVFLEDLFKDIAKRIAETKKEKIPKVKDRSEMGNIRHYLKDKLELSGKDDKFITAFVEILHSEGGHSFTSEKEYFRLARNIAIEIALLVLSKYGKNIK